MHAARRSPAEDPAGTAPHPLDPGLLLPSVAAMLWRGDQLAPPACRVLPTGFAALDAELPGGGWPCGTLVELLQPQPSIAEWRLLGPALGQVAAAGRTIALVGLPKPPHPPGLRHAGIEPERLLWLQADTPAERLWCAEQLVGSGGCAVVAWLPQARAEQIRRLQLAAQGGDDLVVLCRPASAEHEASAAPLRLHVALGADWQLRVRVLKRRGPVHEGALALRSVPGGLDAVLTPRLQQQPALAPFPVSPETADAVGRPAAGREPVRPVAAH